MSPSSIVFTFIYVFYIFIVTNISLISPLFGIYSSRWQTVTLSRCTKNKLEDAC